MENSKIQALLMGNLSKNLNASTFFDMVFKIFFFDSLLCKVKN